MQIPDRGAAGRILAAAKKSAAVLVLLVLMTPFSAEAGQGLLCRDVVMAGAGGTDTQTRVSYSAPGQRIADTAGDSAAAAPVSGSAGSAALSESAAVSSAAGVSGTITVGGELPAAGPGVAPADSGQSGNGETDEAGDTTDGTADAGEAGETSQPQEETPVSLVDPARPMVALTFDDGPMTTVGNAIMDCLALYGARATFFMVGSRVPSRAAEVQRMVAEGHEVANHTQNHRYLQKLSAAEIVSEVTACNDTIEAACGVRPALMRLPGGNYNAAVLAGTGMPMIQWSIDTLDWKTRSADQTVTAVLNGVQDGDIILMHELYSATAEAVARIVPELISRGYQLVTVSEMAAARGTAPAAGQLYYSFR